MEYGSRMRHLFMRYLLRLCSVEETLELYILIEERADRKKLIQQFEFVAEMMKGYIILKEKGQTEASFFWNEKEEEFNIKFN